eukprot:gnl/Spiro4/18027_TR9624_c0_g1_i1.p1 gnl/Spiro4/18027_TR9624_c0_g1~~gnl/Spiro4/18027_TR9624_c0_g1_i1.p1  ORF type:complete len:194 (-),score=45.54 gnl/Spiro4/18027_TR9624_c0_g1_i1:51-602(-)
MVADLATPSFVALVLLCSLGMSYGANSAAVASETKLTKAILSSTTIDARSQIDNLSKVNYSAPCNIPLVVSVSPFPQPFRCAGCVATLAALTSFMKADMNFANPELAQYEFSKACLYVEPDYIQVCQYMFNVHGRHIISMLFGNRVPIHICTCINHCVDDDLQVILKAFQPKSAAGGAPAAPK